MTERPLAGRRIVVTRPRDQAAGLAGELERLGASAPVVPLVEIVSADPSDELEEALHEPGRYDWIVFTSVNGVAAVHDRMHRTDVLAGVEVAAVGPATAAAVREIGVEPAFVPDRFDGRAIAEGLGALAGVRVLLPQGDLASPRLADELRRRGANVDAFVAYRTIPRTPTGEELAELGRAGDAIVLASGSAARALASLADRVPSTRDALLVCIGPTTAEVAREAGLDVGLVADDASADGIIQALVTHFGGSR